MADTKVYPGGKYRVCFVGEGAVGKTCLIMNLTGNGWAGDNGYIPTAFDWTDKEINDQIALTLVDTAPREEYCRLTPLSFPGTNVFLFCFSVIDHHTLEKIERHWFSYASRYCPTARVILVGCKSDLRGHSEYLTNGRREVTVEEAHGVVDRLQMECYLECSAKTSAGVNEIIGQITSRPVDFVPQAVPKKGCTTM